MSQTIDQAVERYRTILINERADMQKRLVALAVSQRYVSTRQILNETYRLRHYLRGAGLEHLVREWTEEVLEPQGADPWDNGLTPWKQRGD